MLTRWGKTLDENTVLPEYPRPQMKRESYLNLNGRWDYAITAEEKQPETWQGTILVPFSPESELSGVRRTLQPGETLWYRRDIALPQGFQRGRVLLHFGAVDQDAAVWVNGREVGRHEGGYNAFTVDITQALTGDGGELIVRVQDDTDASWRTRGKQKMRRGGIWYTPQSGIWQTVWLESVPRDYITGLTLLPHLAEEELELRVDATAELTGEAEVEGCRYPLTANRPLRIPVPEPRLWSPDDPYLYPLMLRVGEDVVQSYFAMREVDVQPDRKGIKRLFLNGKPYFHHGLLDQGYWPDGLYTAPSDEALAFDIQAAKDMGFNMLRKHIKVEPMRWYYHCDRLGMLVWQDMPSGGGEYKTSTISFPLVTGRHLNDHDYRRFAREDEAGRAAYRRELEEMVRQLRACPCIVLWVPFNEGWGQFDAAEATRLIDKTDGTRPVDPASGWHDQHCGELVSRHVYFRPFHFRRDKLGRAVALSEFGGYNLREKGHCWNDEDFGYRRFESVETLQQAFEQLYDTQILPAIPKGLCAAVYTQLTDVEDELNGLMSYDREVVKLPADALRALGRAIEEAASPEKE